MAQKQESRVMMIDVLIKSIASMLERCKLFMIAASEMQNISNDYV